jgi:hypothetical protein
VSVAKAPGDGITGAGPAIITTGSGVGNRLTVEKGAPNPYAYISAPENYCEGLTEDGC